MGAINFGDDGTVQSSGWPGAYMAKLSGEDGRHLWSMAIEAGTASAVVATVPDGSNDVLFTGYFSGTIHLANETLVSGGGYDVFLIRLTPDGELVWADSFGGGGDQVGCAVGADQAGNVLLAGSFAESLDLGGGLLTSAGSSDAFWAKLDAAANYAWSKQAGDASAQAAERILADSQGDVVVGGTFAGTITLGGGIGSAGLNDVFVAKFGP